jgi:hypothetical protein
MDTNSAPDERWPGPTPEDRRGRQYECSKLPILSNSPEAGDKKISPDLLRLELGEASAAWRMLTDVRFKLLALLPPISALALTAIVSPTGILEGADRPVRVAAAVFGFLVTLGLRIYDRRNDDLYDDLISRARRAEFELGIDTGVFRGRKKSRPLWNGRTIHRRLVPLARWAGLIGQPGDPVSVVNHEIALKLVYRTVLLAWLLAGVTAAVGWVP